MYNIVFSGRLLNGYSLPRVREAVARRLGLDLAQLQRLFSGKRMVIKHGVSAESAQHYLALLHELGMDARMEARDGAERLARFKVVYWGSVVEGFSRQMVMNEAARLFRLPPREILGLFSGRKAVLKRGLSAQEGARYVVRLAQIGMQIELEVDAESLPAAPVPTAPVRTTRSAPPPAEAFPELLRTEYELPQQSGSAEEFAAPPPPPPLLQVPPPRPQAHPVAHTVAQGSSRLATPPAMAKKPPEAYMRCSQCGHRQPLAARCKVCGMDVERRRQERRASDRRRIPMDASAYGAPTTVMGGLAPSARASQRVPAEAPARRAARALPQQLLANRQTLLGLGVACMLVLWFLW